MNGLINRNATFWGNITFDNARNYKKQDFTLSRENRFLEKPS